MAMASPMATMDGNSKTWLTYGAPDLPTNKFDKAYSFSFVEHIFLTSHPTYSLNGYALYTKSHGAAESDNKAPIILEDRSSTVKRNMLLVCAISGT
jgi:hypothetical protein